MMTHKDVHVKGMSKRRLNAFNRMHKAVCDAWKVVVDVNDGDEVEAYVVFMGGLMKWFSDLAMHVAEASDKEGAGK